MKTNRWIMIGCLLAVMPMGVADVSAAAPETKLSPDGNRLDSADSRMLNAEQAAIPAGEPGHRSHVKVFFESYCIKCHGPEKSKGKMTLHTLDGNLATGAGGEMERWEKVLKELKSGEMPPEDEKQPSGSERNAMIAWIESGMRKFASTAEQAGPAATARRLTNFEYQNTMRDLLGFELKLISSLPEDPVKPYRFNNTAEFMLIGPEQMDRYLECARRAMASAIVDPGDPKVHRTAQTFASAKKDGERGADIGVYASCGQGE